LDLIVQRFSVLPICIFLPKSETDYAYLEQILKQRLVLSTMARGSGGYRISEQSREPICFELHLVELISRSVTMDQAEGLRKLMKDSTPSPSHVKGPRVISVTSGKGGVGKTNVVANLAFAFTQLGKKVLVLDADFGLSNIDVLLGLAPRYTIEHLFKKEKSFSDILVKGPGGMSIMPAGSGGVDLVNLDEAQKIFLLKI
jgi:Mrp family chromosome partitioning ATPase